MKQRILLVAALLFITANIAIAVPQLKIKNTDLKCDATFQYLTTETYSFPMSNSEYERLNIYGTNITRTLSITTNFYSINPVYKVGISNLVCKVKDVY